MKWTAILLPLLCSTSLAAPWQQVAVVPNAGGCAGIQVVNHVQVPGATSGGTSSAVDMTGANLIVISASAWDQHIPTVSDSSSNTYTGLTAQDDTTFQGYNRIWYVSNPTVTSSMTFTVASGLCNCSGQIIGFKGVAISTPFDVQNGNHAASGLTLQTGSVTPSTTNQLVVTGSNSASASGVSVDSGFSISDSSAFIPGTAYAGAMAYLVETSIVAKNPTWTFVTNGGGAVTIATFKGAC